MMFLWRYGLLIVVVRVRVGVDRFVRVMMLRLVVVLLLLSIDEC
jgi:hypothetical protein